MLVTLSDLRHAARRLVRLRGFTAATIATLTIGIGCTTLVFSVVNGLLLSAIPYTTPERLGVITPRVPVFLWNVVDELHDATDVFEQVAVYTERAANLSGEGLPERIQIARVSGNFFSVMGVRPAFGRLFLREELQPGRGNVALLTDATWRRRYAASRNVVGRILDIDGQGYAIVGVLRPDFKTVEEMQPAREVWLDARVAALVPLPGRPSYSRDEGGSDPAANSRGLTIVCRLRAGAPFARARTFASAITDRTIPVAAGFPVFSLQPLPTAVAGDLPRQLAILSAAVAMLLLVSCANVANLMLERMQARRREMATCAALGASGAQLAGSVLAETIWLGGAGGVGGVLAAWVGLRAVQSLVAPMLTRMDDVTVDLRVLVVAAATSLGTGLLVGLIPAIHMARGNTADWLQAQPSAPRQRGRLVVPSLLVVAQVALSVMLVVAGALLARDFVRSTALNLGFRTDGILSTEVSLNPFKYRGAAATAFFHNLMQRATNLPGVDKAALVDCVPAGQFVGFTKIQVAGRTPEIGIVRSVSDSYFSTLAIPMIAGRSLGRADASNVVIVNDAFARKYWDSARDALNQQVMFGGTDGDGRVASARLFTIVGVAADAREAGIESSAWPTVYRNYDQWSGPNVNTQMTLLLRARHGDGTALAQPLRQIVRALDPAVPLYNVLTLRRLVYAKFARQRVILLTMTLFAGLTLLVAAVGVHGVMAYAVALRKQEIGVRLALGGSRHAIFGLQLRRGAALIAGGLAIGLPVAVAVGWVVQSELFDIDASDVVLCLGAAVLVVIGGLTASISPALRAVRVDPIETLRSE